MSFLLPEKEHMELQGLTERLIRDTGASITFIVDINGVLICFAGGNEDVDKTSLASLAAGHVAATTGLAKLIRENEFSNLIHEGAKSNIYLAIVNPQITLVTIFDRGASLGLVRLRVKRVIAEIKQVFKRLEELDNAEAADPFADLGDGEIDDIFGDEFDDMFDV